MSEHKAWRDIAAPVVERVLADNMGASETEIQKALERAFENAFPGSYYDDAKRYRVWREVVRKARGKPREKAPDPRQLRLW